MGQGPRFRPQFRRRRTGQTDYRKRLALLSSHRPRVVVRPSNRGMTVQFVEYANGGDTVRAQAVARELAGHGLGSSHGSLPAAYLTGLLAGQRAKKAGVTEAVLDLGRLQPVPGGRLFAALKGVLDAGVDVPHSDDVLPDEGRVKGEHLAEGRGAQFETARSKIQGGA